MRIIAASTLREYEQEYPNARGHLEAWEDDTERADWSSPNDVKQRYANASILNNRRVVFNIKGNDYRLIVEIHYQSKLVFIRWFGTHAEYDDVNAYSI